jgi:catalase
MPRSTRPDTAGSHHVVSVVVAGQAGVIWAFRPVALLIAPGVAGNCHGGARGTGCGRSGSKLVASASVPSTSDGKVLLGIYSLKASLGFHLMLGVTSPPEGVAGVAALAKDAHTMEFIPEPVPHCKSILCSVHQKTLTEVLANCAPTVMLILVCCTRSADKLHAGVHGGYDEAPAFWFVKQILRTV